ncbi:hypothetical protein MBEHAL_1510 [Halarchaeum acidiphilum MH1-52-1]|uniref:Uncharacterized protein n=1 Tax=Halarchaeum acidiphilum MH1-52-1 TaxID=1261545 RepID=U2YUQ4_9EURY|nr:hypothetical protein MBEHAL_1510 [Halarchaeum acidiphilum MH1-52-1]
MSEKPEKTRIGSDAVPLPDDRSRTPNGARSFAAALASALRSIDPRPDPLPEN